MPQHWFETNVFIGPLNDVSSLSSDQKCDEKLDCISGSDEHITHNGCFPNVANNENAWAFTYLPRSPNGHSFCPKVLLLWWIETQAQIYNKQTGPIILPPFLNWEDEGHYITSHHKPQWLYMEILRLKPKSRFLTSWPWPLTYDLGHWTWPRYFPGRPPCKISCPHVKRLGCESAHRHTHTQTETRLRFYNLDRWRGR